MSLGAPLLCGPVWTAAVAAALLFLERGSISVSDYFDGYRFFLPALLASLLVGLLTVLGLILLIVPGLVIFSMYLLTFPALCRQGTAGRVGAAMQESRRLTGRDYFGFTLFSLALAGLNLLGLLFFGAGLVFSVPISACAVAVAYREALGLPAEVGPPEAGAPVVIE